MQDSKHEKQFVLVILTARCAFGPFATSDEAEYAAQDYYGTTVTGASIKGEFMIVALCDGNDMAERQREAHVRAIFATEA